MGTYLPGTGTLGCGALCGAGTPHSWYIPPEFLPTTCGCGTSLFSMSAPFTYLGGCGFFNSMVVRLPFKLISDGPEWWLFYSLAVILWGGKSCLPMLPSWLEVSHMLFKHKKSVMIILEWIMTKKSLVFWLNYHSGLQGTAWNTLMKDQWSWHWESHITIKPTWWCLFPYTK